ncbi:MAG TPA: glutamate synthase subunit alpha, partial [Nocardioides sp.]|nr:glutamate synthase subunit alpha [Nocardioides sp.]
MPYQHSYPTSQGLYDPANEKDACGVAFVATLTGVASHEIVEKGVAALVNLDHRGAAGAEANSGDGAGILVQVPDAFLREVVDFDLPAAGAYAVGTAFLPGDAAQVASAVEVIEKIAVDEGLTVLGWREVPVETETLGATALAAMPTFRQIFVAATGGEALTGLPLERLAFVLRKRAERETDAYFPSLSSRTLVYKGMLTTEQLGEVFPDLRDQRFTSAIAVVHSR